MTRKSPPGSADVDETLRKGLNDLVWHLGRSMCRPAAQGDGVMRADALMRSFLHSLEIMGDRRGLAACQYHLGNAAYRRGDYVGAAEWYRRYLALQGEDDPGGVARVYHQLGLVAQRRNDLAGAIECYCKSIERSTQSRDRVAVAQTAHQLGNVFCLQGGFDDAVTCYGVCLEIAEIQGDSTGVARSYYQLALVAEARGDTRRADELFETGRSIADASGSTINTVRCLRGLSRLAIKLDNRRSALRCLESALALAEGSGLKDEAAKAASAIGILYTELGQPETGLDYTLMSMAARLAEGEPPGGIDTSSLRRQCGALGARRFGALVMSRLRKDHAAAVMTLVTDGAAMAATGT